MLNGGIHHATDHQNLLKEILKLTNQIQLLTTKVISLNLKKENEDDDNNSLSIQGKENETNNEELYIHTDPLNVLKGNHVESHAILQTNNESAISSSTNVKEYEADDKNIFIVNQDPLKENYFENCATSGNNGESTLSLAESKKEIEINIQNSFGNLNKSINSNSNGFSSQSECVSLFKKGNAKDDFSCQVCFESFADKIDLNQHEKIHIEKYFTPETNNWDKSGTFNQSKTKHEAQKVIGVSEEQNDHEPAS